MAGGFDPATGMGWPNAYLNMAKTHCPKGHPYDERNTLRYYGRRRCRTCQLAYQAAWRARRREAAR